MSVYVIRPSDSDLMHHGIKGQRWGVRRYQNEDGSLTVVGRRRLSSSTPLLEGPTSDSGGSGSGSSRSKSSSSSTPLLEGPTSDSGGSGSGSSRSKSSSSKSSSKKDDFIEGTWREVDDEPSSSSSKTKSSRKDKSSKKPDNIMDGEWRKVDEPKTKDTSKKADTKETSDGSEKAKKNYEGTSATLSSVSKLSKTLAEAEQKKLAADKSKVMKAIDVSKMSDADLKAAISRMSSEDTYKKMTAERVDYGREKTIKRLQTIGEVAAVGSSVVGLLASIEKLKK